MSVIVVFLRPLGPSDLFKLRKGTKWSDGKDFTSADIKWNHDNVLKNKLLTPAGNTKYQSGAKKTWAEVTTRIR